MRDELEQMIDELRLLYNLIVQVVEEIHDDISVTLSMRAVLEYLSRNGASAVPDIARRRRVTRQHIQTIVNDLLDYELVTLAPNPRHRRSSLVQLTADGQNTIDVMRDAEARFFGALELPATADELATASRTLAKVRVALEATR